MVEEICWLKALHTWLYPPIRTETKISVKAECCGLVYPSMKRLNPYPSAGVQRLFLSDQTCTRWKASYKNIHTASPLSPCPPTLLFLRSSCPSFGKSLALTLFKVNEAFCFFCFFLSFQCVFLSKACCWGRIWQSDMKWEHHSGVSGEHNDNFLDKKVSSLWLS